MLIIDFHFHTPDICFFGAIAAAATRALRHMPRC